MDQETWDHLTKYKHWGSFDGEYPAASRTFYAPYDDVHAVILAVVESAKQSLHIAMFGYADPEVNDAILKVAANPAIRVKIALDSTQAAGKGEGRLLRLWPQTDYLNTLVIGQSVKHALNHDKLIVADDCMLSGSTNLSESAETRQTNQCTVEWNSRKAVEGLVLIERIFSEMVASPRVEGYRHLVGGVPDGIHMVGGG